MKFSASLRRVGDTCARRKQVFSGSPDIKVRIFSCLLILQTLSQGRHYTSITVVMIFLTFAVVVVVVVLIIADLICSSLERLKQDLSAAEVNRIYRPYMKLRYFVSVFVNFSPSGSVSVSVRMWCEGIAALFPTSSQIPSDESTGHGHFCASLD